MSALEKFNFEKVTDIIGSRIFKNIDETLTHQADVILFEILQEFKVIGSFASYADHELAINMLFDLKQIQFQIKIGNQEFDMRNLVLDLLYDN